MVLLPTLAIAVLLVQQNYNWIFGIMIGAAIALSSCELIQKAVNNSFVRKSGAAPQLFLFRIFLPLHFLRCAVVRGDCSFQNQRCCNCRQFHHNTTLLSSLPCEFMGETTAPCLNTK